MPRKQKQASAVGPYDLSTIQLPFGSEFDALSSGFARERAGREGYTQAALIANEQLLADTENAYLVVDLNSQHGKIGRAITKPAMFEEYHTDIMKTLPDTYESKLSHDIKKRMGIPRDQGVAVGLPGEYVFKPSQNVYITHVKSARKGLGMRPVVRKPTPFITDSEMDQLLLNMHT
jgi:hypothetical protein